MSRIILVTGATGYIASRLIPRLLDQGYTVRCLARNPARLAGRTWFSRVEVVPGDVTRPDMLTEAMRGVSAAYYLIHNMAAGEGYHDIDLQSARNFALAARDAGVEHIIYLGGLANPVHSALALHLKSRIESGMALRESGVPVTEFRAGIIIGPGSVSFEMIRFMAEQLPVLVGPSWLRHLSQPIAASNVLDFLVAALTMPAVRGLVIEIGVPEKQRYIDIMVRYARLRGLKRNPILIPFIPLSLMAHVIDKFTPVHISYAFPLVESLQADSIVRDRNHLELFPQIQLIDFDEAVLQALAETRPDKIERVWLDLDRDNVRIKHEGMFIDYRRISVDGPVDSVFPVLQKWVQAGMRPGSMHIFEQEYLGGNILRLKISQRIPGEAWLEWKVTKNAGGSRLEQTMFFAPKGLPGFWGWYLFEPIHRWLFARLIEKMARRS